MKRVLKGICNFCKNKSENIYGDYCLKAYYRDHGGGYGDSWTNNLCKYDENHKFEDLFIAIDESETIKKLELQTEKVMQMGKTIDELYAENINLRRLVSSNSKRDNLKEV